MTTWHEECEWTYFASGTDEFVPFIENDRLKYYFTNNVTQITNWLDINTTNLRPGYLSANFRRANPNPHSIAKNFIGPLLPPPSPVILKIRQMEKHFNERKNKPIIDNSW